ncbi:MAG: phosphopentomutase [Verrucomicrobiota bacterium]
MRRSIIWVIDSFGCGALPDADAYGDVGSNTGLHICQAMNGAKWPELTAAGLGNAVSLLEQVWAGVPAIDDPAFGFGIMAEASPGKDTTTGHWELAGVRLDKPLHVFPQTGPAFPEWLLERVSAEFACDILGNESASGTEIIQRLGAQHLKRGAPIFYTSADPVVQIATHEDIWPVERLYELCAFVRKEVDALEVGRVIARPFEGGPGTFRRTPRRKDFSMPVPGGTLMDQLQSSGIETLGVGKIGNIFNDQGFDRSYPEKGNPDCIARSLELLSESPSRSQFVFVNLVDTDQEFGHRRDPVGYHDAVAAIDAKIPEVLARLRPDDQFIITADHGCDPTFRGTDHTREYVPLLVWGAESGKDLGVSSSFCRVAELVEGWLL